MKSEIKELFTKIAETSGTDAKGFIDMLETPDNEFDEIYPFFKQELDKIYSTQEYQEKLIAQMQLMPNINLQEEKSISEKLLEQVDGDETLSPNKKDFIHTILDTTLNVISDLIECKRIRVDVSIVKLNPEAKIPEYAHSTDAGADIFAIEDTEIAAGETKLVGTGIAVAIPEGYEIQIRPRSGLSFKTSLRIANATATIDSDYRGEIKVIMTNTGTTSYTIHKYDKIAQMLIAPTPMIRWHEVETIEELGSTDRGTGGFGSTDKS